MSIKRFVCLLFAAGASLSTACAQNNFSFEGLFLSDDQVQLFTFTLAPSETVSFQTFGYGGGTNSKGQPVQSGGFESLLSWFGPDGSYIGNSANYGCGSGQIYLFDCLDVFANPSLGPGTYTLALTVWENAALGTGNPGDLSLNPAFQYQGQPNFTAVGSCTAFCDSQQNQDNGNWAVDILGVDSATISTATPEPVTMLLGGCGLVLLGLAKRRRAKKDGTKSVGNSGDCL
jgi:hypothetical protein